MKLWREREVRAWNDGKESSYFAFVLLYLDQPSAGVGFSWTAVRTETALHAGYNPLTITIEGTRSIEHLLPLLHPSS